MKTCRSFVDSSSVQETPSGQAHTGSSRQLGGDADVSSVSRYLVPVSRQCPGSVQAVSGQCMYLLLGGSVGQAQDTGPPAEAGVVMSRW